ncbi:MAG: SH3 domain-containing protein [Clostridia bacterium]|nr:SH3 domain-containing protein [Clostridia bacterium]
MTKRILSFILAFALLVTSFTIVTDKPIESVAAPTCYQQGDSQWGGIYYGSWTLAESGCGILAAVNAINYLTGNFIHPTTIAQWAYENNHFNGSYGQGSVRATLYPALSTKLGSTYGFSISNLTYSTVTNTTLINHLTNGGVAIVHVPNHFMALCGYNTSTGQYLVYDSSANATTRGTYAWGTWLTAAELNSRSASTIDWFCLMSPTGTSGSTTTATYSLTATVAAGEGTVHFGNNVTSTTVAAGTVVNYQVTPADGWEVSQVLIYGTKQNVSAEGGTYQFTMEAAAATVSVTFTQKAPTVYTVVATVASGEGTVHFGNNVTTAQVAAGTVVNYQVTPGSCYAVSSIVVGGTSVTVQNNGGEYVYQFTMPAGDCEIVVSFKQTSFLTGVYEITYSSSMNVRSAPVDGTIIGTVSPGTRITALEITDTYWAKIIYKGQIGYVSVYTTYATYVNSNTIAESDIIFDTSKEVSWVQSSGVADTAVSLGACPSGDTCMVVAASSSSDPQLNMNFTSLGTLNASNYKYMVVTAKSSASNVNAKMYLCAGSVTAPTEDSTASWTWNNDGLWHDYLIDLSGISSWTGALNLIRFDYFDGTTAADSILYLRSIKFYTSAPSSPKVTTNKTTYTVGESITISYSGLGSYLSTMQNQAPFVAIYKSGQEPGSIGSLMWKAVSTSSGSLTFPADANMGDSMTTGTILPAGNYMAWIAYDAVGSSGTVSLNNVHYANSGTYYNFTIEESATSTSYVDKVGTGISTGSSAVFVHIGGTASGVIAELKSSLGASSVTITKDGTAVSGTATLSTGMTVTADSKTYTVVIKGDVDGDGSVTIADANTVMSSIKGSATLSGSYKDAAMECSGRQSSSLSILEVMAILNIL